jgi:hypothetical protein
MHVRTALPLCTLSLADGFEEFRGIELKAFHFFFEV